MVIYALTFKKVNNERDVKPKPLVLGISSNLKHLYRAAAKYLQKAAKDYPSLAAFLYTNDSWHDGTNLVLAYQAGDKVKTKNVIWSKLIFNGVPASKIIKAEKQRSKLAKQKATQAEVDLKTQLRKNMNKLPLPQSKASGKF